MADPYQYVALTGVILPDTGELLAEVQAEWRSSFGQDLVLTPDTPQGVLATAEALARDAVVRNNAALANQINPNLAGGVFLDAIWALTGGQRNTANPSYLVGVELAGVPGTFIPEGARARVGAGGAIFETGNPVTLNGAGMGTANMRSLDTGPIAAAAGALDTIVTGILGWETVTNPTAAILGQQTESDQAARARRRVTLAANGVALPEAITSALFLTEGVTSVLFRENVSGDPLVEEGVTINPHSILAVVDGGTDGDVAQALLNNKSLGAGWSGTTTVNVTEPYSGQVYPVTFLRPALVTVFINITVRQLAAGGDPAATVKAAILAYAAGQLDNEPGLVIGQDVSSFEIAGAVNRQAPDLYVSAVTVGTAPAPTGTTPVHITIGQRAQVLANNITVSVV